MTKRRLTLRSEHARPILFSALLLGALGASCSDAAGPSEEPKGFAKETWDEDMIVIAPGARTQAVITQEKETPEGEETSPPTPIDGGAGTGGGEPAAGGSSATGGGPAAGGATGGGPAAGGSFATGGGPAAGGSVGKGGSPGAGGGTAGTTGKAGAGGTSNAGGSTATGGFGGKDGSGGKDGTGGSTAGAGGFGAFGGSAGGGGGSAKPTAFWQFDDCSPRTRTLLDSSGNNIHAQRTVSTACGAGISGQGMVFDEAKDRVEALNGPDFALSQRIAVAAWINPKQVDGVRRPIVLKRLQNQTAFSFAVQDDLVTFTVVLQGGKTVTAPFEIRMNEWSHVAALYNGRFVHMFVNGEQVGQVFAPGEIRDVDVPIRIGGTTQNQNFLGSIDNVWISTNEVSPADIAALSCMRGGSAFSIDPKTSGPVAAGTPFNYALTVANTDVGKCAPRTYFTNAFPLSFPSEPSLQISSPRPLQLAPGQTETAIINVSSDPSAEAGRFPIGVSVSGNEPGDFFFSEIEYEITESNPTGCNVRTNRELLIRDLSVVEDKLRTTFAAEGAPGSGAWTFGRLMEQMAPSAADAPQMVTNIFNTWLSDQTVNGNVIPARPAMQTTVLNSWPKTPDGLLDLKQAPLRLLAIVNRMDLRDLSQGKAGEGRFVFGVLGPGGGQLEFTAILEYILPASTEADVLDWAQRWHALSELPFPSEEYNAALQAITDRFAGRNAAPGRPNGSALSQFRTNEIALNFPWELREFQFGPDGFLSPNTVKLTPQNGFNNSSLLANFINQNQTEIIAERHTVPETFDGQSFLAGAVLNGGFDFWTAPGIANNEARHKFSLNTCNGCHSGAETGTRFLHVFPRSPGQQSQLSGFMTGINVPDPVDFEQQRFFNDLGRRNADLKGLVCPPEEIIVDPIGPKPPIPGPKPLPAAKSIARSTAVLKSNISKGIGRVH